MAFTDTSVLSRSYAGRLRQEVDQNQELAVLGVANVATGLLPGLPRLHEQLAHRGRRGRRRPQPVRRARRAPASWPLLLIVGTGLVHDLPLSTLAAIVIVAVLGFIDIGAARRLRHWRRSEFALAMAAFTGVAVLGVLWGVGIAIALSLLNFIRRAWRPHDAVLGRVDNLKGYHDIERYPDARRIPGLVLYRFDAPLFFANADYFRERVRALARSGDVTWIVVAAEPITDVDATAGETLRGLNDELDAAGIELAFAELKDPVRDRLRRYGIDDAIGAQRFFPTIGVAVAAYVRETGVDWLDWEERPPTPQRATPLDYDRRLHCPAHRTGGHPDLRRGRERAADVRRGARQLAARDWDGHVLIVDDDSPDGTGEIVAAAAEGNPRIGVLRRTGKDGLGVAYRDGFRRALSEGADAVCQMDCDFSHRPEDLPALAQLVLDGRADVAIGSRYVPGGGTSDWSRIRLVLSRIGAAWCRMVLGVRVRDISGGLKAWAPAALTVAVEQAHSAGFAFQAEATFLASRAGYRAVEVPIIFQERAAGESKMSPRITIEGAWRLVALRWTHRRGR